MGIWQINFMGLFGPLFRENLRFRSVFISAHKHKHNLQPSISKRFYEPFMDIS